MCAKITPKHTIRGFRKVFDKPRIELPSRPQCSKAQARNSTGKQQQSVVEINTIVFVVSFKGDY